MRNAVNAAAATERPLAAVPAAVWLALAATLALQIGWHAWRPGPRAEAWALGPAPAVSTLRLAALGDEAALAKLLLLRLHAHDRQPGVSIPYTALDYDRVAGWLDAIIDLDPRAGAPLLAAARLYGAVPDPDRQRTMFELVHRRFLEDPHRRWPWLAHAAVMAKHRLADPALALRYACALAEHATGPGVPAWVRDMPTLVIDDAPRSGDTSRSGPTRDGPQLHCHGRVTGMASSVMSAAGLAPRQRRTVRRAPRPPAPGRDAGRAGGRARREKRGPATHVTKRSWSGAGPPRSMKGSRVANGLFLGVRTSCPQRAEGPRLFMRAGCPRSQDGAIPERTFTPNPGRSLPCHADNTASPSSRSPSCWS